MQLKIQINVPQDPISQPEPAPFDPIKIRNFLLLVITLFSLIGFGVYSMWTKEPQPSSPNTLNLANNAELKNVATTPPKKMINHEEKTRPSDITVADEAINTTLETNISEKTLTIIGSASVKSPLITNSSVPSVEEIKPLEQEPEIKQEALKSINVTPTIVNKPVQQKTELFASKQTINKGIHRVQLTSHILAKEPIDNINHLNLQGQNKLYLFTEIHGKSNQKIYHRWLFNKNLMAEIPLNIRNSSWRTYSSKNFDETMIGRWEVQIVDQNDIILKTVRFEVSR